MTLFNTSFNSKIPGSLYSARQKVIRKRKELIRLFGFPPDRVWFHVKEDKNTITLYLQHTQFTTTEARLYVDKVSSSLLVAA